ncbi:MAG TPA: LacI family DNA-binding transcriptional regulator [Phycisphaerae bacterium]|nr:LacI family DNA-binding transcriptional regulator [Phycisphaerae bacterium]
MKMTITKLAKLANVSCGTVSRALNNKAEVNPATKEKVIRLATQLGYEPNGMAKSLRSRQTNALGLIITEIVDPFFAELTQAIEKKADENGFHLVLGVVGNKVRREAEYVRFFQAGRVDGMMIVPASGILGFSELDYIFELKRANFPFVVLGSTNQLETNCVGYDDELGAYKLTSHLIDLGHKKISFIYDISMIGATQPRLNGYRRAFFDHGIAVPEDMLVGVSGTSLNNVGCETARILNRFERPTAIIGINDLVALGILRGIRETGLRVPDDVAVAGFDNIEFLQSLDIPLTTVALPIDELAQKAVDLLITIIHSGSQEKMERIILEPELIIRHSTQRK